MIKVYLWDPIDRKAERFEIVTEKMKVSHKSISDTRETVNIAKRFASGTQTKGIFEKFELGYAHGRVKDMAPQVSKRSAASHFTSIYVHPETSLKTVIGLIDCVSFNNNNNKQLNVEKHLARG